MQRFALVSIALLSLMASLATAKGPAYTDPKQAGADFEIQGEYVGDLVKDGEKERYGLHLIALGKGKFRVVGYHGGLPGEGWNGEDPVKVDGEFALQDDGSVTFKDKHGVGRLKDGVMTCDLGDDGTVDGKLKKVVRQSPTIGEKPPQGAVVLFGGADDAKLWEGGKADEAGYLIQGVNSKQLFGSHKLHLEFRLPFMPESRGQGRGNSGCYLQGRYEVQVLDSFGLDGKMNECGGIYSVKDVDVNMCFPPLSWQTYDIDFTAAKYEGGKLVVNPRITVRHNGVVVQDDVELPGNRNTTAAPLKAGPEPGPVHLQNHGNPVRYRNIWVVKKDS